LKKTDYAKIASVYDENRDRLKIPIDKTLESLLSDGRKIRVLDLACGTGSNLKVQSEYFANSNVEWYGVDISAEMLSIARSKVPCAHLSIGNAESLEFEDNFFDYICCNFAFHHFGNKVLVLDTIRRLLKKRGVLKIRNVAPEFMKNWWVYDYCPETYFEDLHRFWSKDLIVFELENRGFQSNVSVAYEENYKSLELILSEYIRRDNSQLAISSDKSYAAGLERLKKEIGLGMTEVKSEFALMEIEAVKQ
jgi:ubiquinone/menaquinone biosynthesis C-methylase UbiE